MKKLLFIPLLIIAFACQNDELNMKAAPNMSSMLSNMRNTYTSTFRDVLKSKDAYDGSFNYLKRNYFSGELKLNPSLIKNDVINARTLTVPDLSYLTSEQQALAAPFLQKILTIDELSDADGVISNFNSAVLNSSLSEEHKFELLSISSVVDAGVSLIENTIATQQQKSGRVATEWNFRGALQAGVVGLGIGGIRGGYIGCTGGTVIFPGLGTASGCVGGAVIGGAVGFIGGVATSLLQDFLFN